MTPFQDQIESNDRRQVTITIASLAFVGLVITIACIAIFFITGERKPLFLAVAAMGFIAFALGVRKLLLGSRRGKS